MTQETLNIILLLTPIVIGGIIALLNSDGVNYTTEKAEAWTRKTQVSTSSANVWLSRYVVNPILWIIVKFFDRTDSFTHRGLKNGARVSATLYLTAVWIFILYAAFMVAVAIAIVGVILYIAFKVLANSNETECRHCGSKNHASDKCPHEKSIFGSATECKHCGSKDHASDKCPHEKSIFGSETECRNCGGKNHASDNCPHEKSVFGNDTECRHCGSKDHASDKCPHEKSIFGNDTECRHCGSKDHASDKCPHE